ncbi:MULTISPECIES: polysaccharide deacetylase family protein [unclassified Cryobacterium]|uniref:polysaccharide deacetylase family protein n=1 Tax=unclassified Cryobacterium TaxID=2649013 RepID=UPI002AB46047|nr:MULTISPECIES: polysaccharide deacetylase family protein [unclassified Cryobacterium]MDY7542487.1 polysaccharide deacetylase family protein [Cryobacterium sp. 5B3]MEA9998229.1 polysaccharide deacetylase family protein [Cryobacterium sp. RTS3]MEB0266651.1 polysaccharide deacetylase family protein [Cryobacterium sp. 10I5]MEB0275326.1 polysaccharide deacetylase family protein [Cryobacterium sp. 5B3]
MDVQPRFPAATKQRLTGTFSRRRPRWLAWSTTFVLALVSVGVADGFAALPASAAVPAVITLTFDDANADQLTAASILKANGLHGTFYTPSGYVNQPGYLTVAQMQGLVADGNEIGGHTVTHPDLATLPTDEATRQVCNDRVNLTNWGFRVTSFAYPFASLLTPATETIVKNCGYNSARGLGDIQTRFGCTGCALSESIPPADPYLTQAPDEVDNTWSLTDLQNTVIQAETAGGWQQLTFHHIATGLTDPLTISPTLFTQFVQWLKTRPATTTIKTVDQVIGGTVKAVVSGPAVAPKPVGSNLVSNPGFETLTAGVPQCWQGASFGTNTPAFTTVSPGRTGNRAGRLTMTGYSNGDAKWLPTPDLGGCAPAATPGTAYALSAWYKSTAATQIEVYYRTGLGSWTYWTASPLFAASATYQKASWTTPALPAGASAITFGLNLLSNGTLTTDDYTAFDAATLPVPPPPAPGTNLVQNSSLETAGVAALPQCYQIGGYGTNTAAFTTVATAHTGTKAEKLVVTNYANGDAKLLPSLDSGACAPPAIAGHTYSLRAWYTSTTSTQFAVYYRDASGTWQYWTSSPWLATASAFTQASFTTPVLPAGATAISFGLNLFSNGTLVTDDYAMFDTVGAPAL